MYFQAKTSELFSAPSKPPRAAGDKSLLVKVIKASGLGGGKDFGKDSLQQTHLSLTFAW